MIYETALDESYTVRFGVGGIFIFFKLRLNFWPKIFVFFKCRSTDYFHTFSVDRSFWPWFRAFSSAYPSLLVR